MIYLFVTLSLTLKIKLGSCIKPVCIIEIEMLKIVDRDMHDFLFLL